MTSASDGVYEWVEILEPQSHERMYANPVTGELLFSPPEGAKVKPMTQNQWWELYDSGSDKNYYYNAHTGETVWNRPNKDADIISLTKIQNVPVSDEDVHTPLQQGGYEGGGGGGGGEEEEQEEPDYALPPDARDVKNGQDDENNRKSDIFSKRLETLSPLSFEVGGEMFSSQQQTFFAPGNSSHQQQHKGASSRRTDLDSYNHTPHQTSPSPTDQDESVFDSQQDQLREEEGSRHSLSPSHGSTMDHLDTQNLSYDKKSRTLEMPAKPNRKSRTRLGSNPVPIRPAHPAPKPPAVASKPTRSPSCRVPMTSAPTPPLLKSKTLMETPVVTIDGAAKKPSKGDIPPAPPPFKLATHPATVGSKAAESLEHFKDLVQHRRGFFRKKVTIANMLSWTKDPIKQQKKDAVELFKLVLQYMGDRKSKEQSDTRLGAVHHCTSILPSLLQVPVLSEGVPLETC